MMMADRKEMMSVPHLEQNFADKASVADEWNRVKGMRCGGRRKSSLGSRELVVGSLELKSSEVQEFGSERVTECKSKRV